MKRHNNKNTTKHTQISKDELSQADMQAGINTVEEQSAPHAPLETPDGKNNGALPAAYRGQHSNRT
ncbi:MAG TPA: hypothetical protein VIM89_09460 [Mucilaginibacter sp.]